MNTDLTEGNLLRVKENDSEKHLRVFTLIFGKSEVVFFTCGTAYSGMNQVEFVEVSLLKILPGPFLNTLPRIFFLR